MDELVRAKIEAQEALLLFLLKRFAVFEIRDFGAKLELSTAGRAEFDRLAGLGGRKGTG